MMQNTGKAKRGFNLLAPLYDTGLHLFFGRTIEFSQQYFLSEFVNCKRVLVFGGGTGYLLPELFAGTNVSYILFVDISDKMIDKARQRLLKKNPERAGDVNFVCGSYTDIPADSNFFDLVITPYVLDCFKEEELELVVPALAKQLKKEGQWLFIDFNIPSRRISGFIARMVIRPLYFFFNLICGLGIRRLPPFEKIFSSASWKVKKEHYFCSGLLTAKIYSR